MKQLFLTSLLISLSLGCYDSLHAQNASPVGQGWQHYGGDAGGTRYAALTQINKTNVAQLQEAWRYQTGELGQESASERKLTFEATPILFDGRLYISTAFGKVAALDPVSGKEVWTFDPEVDRSVQYSELTSRGVSAWRDASSPSDAPCASRIIEGTIDARLIAVDAKTGELCQQFGENGAVYLGRDVGTHDNPRHQDYQVTSPPAIINDRIVVGSSIGDNWHADTGSGRVRAYDARTGDLLWTWEPIYHTKGKVGAANAWTILSADAERDLVFVPTTSPSPDFYGGHRLGDNRYANSIVALHAETGKIAWHFQTVHHDLWDYDHAAQPALVDIERDGSSVPAVVVATKTGNLFVLHRETGNPLFPIEERPVPQTDIDGEVTHPTQPFSIVPRPLMPHGPVTMDDIWGISEADREECQALFQGRRSEGIFTPPSLEGTIMYPGNGAGTNWGSVAYEPDQNLLILNTMRYATIVQLIPRDEVENERANPEPGFTLSQQRNTPYAMKRRNFVASSGIPCLAPPWGLLHAVDLRTGDIEWEVPLGMGPDGEMIGIPNFGGPIVTAGGLMFIGATFDNQLRAFDVETGEMLWSTALPHSAIATPMTYQADDGKQYLVIAAGGHGKANLPVGDFVIAFALP